MAMKHAPNKPPRSGLVLQIKLGDSIRVGDDIEFTMVGYGPNRFKVHVSAPRDVGIARDRPDLKPEGD